jgi:hypothetical protein
MNSHDLRKLQADLGKASFYLGMAATAIGVFLWASANLAGRRR